MESSLWHGGSGPLRCLLSYLNKAFPEGIPISEAFDAVNTIPTYNRGPEGLDALWQAVARRDDILLSNPDEKLSQSPLKELSYPELLSRGHGAIKIHLSEALYPESTAGPKMVWGGNGFIQQPPSTPASAAPGAQISSTSYPAGTFSTYVAQEASPIPRSTSPYTAFTPQPADTILSNAGAPIPRNTSTFNLSTSQSAASSQSNAIQYNTPIPTNTSRLSAPSPADTVMSNTPQNSSPIPLTTSYHTLTRRPANTVLLNAAQDGTPIPTSTISDNSAGPQPIDTGLSNAARETADEAFAVAPIFVQGNEPTPANTSSHSNVSANNTNHVSSQAPMEASTAARNAVNTEIVSKVRKKPGPNPKNKPAQSVAATMAQKTVPTSPPTTQNDSMAMFPTLDPSSTLPQTPRRRGRLDSQPSSATRHTPRITRDERPVGEAIFTSQGQIDYQSGASGVFFDIPNTGDPRVRRGRKPLSSVAVFRLPALRDPEHLQKNKGTWAPHFAELLHKDVENVKETTKRPKRNVKPYKKREKVPDLSPSFTSDNTLPPSQALTHPQLSMLQSSETGAWELLSPAHHEKLKRGRATKKALVASPSSPLSLVLATDVPSPQGTPATPLILVQTSVETPAHDTSSLQPSEGTAEQDSESQSTAHQATISENISSSHSFKNSTDVSHRASSGNVLLKTTVPISPPAASLVPILPPTLRRYSSPYAPGSVSETNGLPLNQLVDVPTQTARHHVQSAEQNIGVNDVSRSEFPANAHAPQIPALASLVSNMNQTPSYLSPYSPLQNRKASLDDHEMMAPSQSSSLIDPNHQVKGSPAVPKAKRTRGRKAAAPAPAPQFSHSLHLQQIDLQTAPLPNVGFNGRRADILTPLISPAFPSREFPQGTQQQQITDPMNGVVFTSSNPQTGQQASGAVFTPPSFGGAYNTQPPADYPLKHDHGSMHFSHAAQMPSYPVPPLFGSHLEYNQNGAPAYTTISANPGFDHDMLRTPRPNGAISSNMSRSEHVEATADVSMENSAQLDTEISAPVQPTDTEGNVPKARNTRKRKKASMSSEDDDFQETPQPKVRKTRKRQIAGQEPDSFDTPSRKSARLSTIDEELDNLLLLAEEISVPDGLIRLACVFEHKYAGNLVLSQDFTTLEFFWTDQHPPQTPMLTLAVIEIKENPITSVRGSKPMQLRIKVINQDDEEDPAIHSFIYGPSPARAEAATNMRSKIVIAMEAEKLRAGVEYVRPSEVRAGIVRPFLCEKCNSRFKNINGLQYHQTKSKSACNPKFDPALEPDKRVGRAKKIAKAQDSEVISDEEEFVPVENSDDNSAKPRRARRAKAYKAAAILETDFVENDEDASDFDLRKPSPKPKRPRKKKPAKVLQPETEEIESDGSEDSFMEWERTTNGVDSSPKPARVYKAFNNETPLSKDILQAFHESLENVEDPSALNPPALFSTGLPSLSDLADQMSSGEKLTEKVCRRMILALVRANNDVLPGHKSIWVACVALWLKKHPTTHVMPRSTFCNRMTDNLIDAGKLETQPFDYMGLRRRQLVGTFVYIPGADLESQRCQMLKSLVQECTPRIYVPSHLAPTQAVLDGLQTIAGRLTSNEPKPPVEAEEAEDEDLVQFDVNSPEPVEDALFEESTDDEFNQDDMDAETGDENYEDNEDAGGGSDIDLGVDEHSLGLVGAGEGLSQSRARRRRKSSLTPHRRAREPAHNANISQGGYKYWAKVHDGVIQRALDPRKKKSRQDKKFEAGQSASQTWTEAPSFMPNHQTGAWDVSIEPAPKPTRSSQSGRRYQSRIPHTAEPITYLQAMDGSWSVRPYGHGVKPVFSRPGRRTDGNPNLAAYLKRVELGHRPVVYPEKGMLRPYAPSKQMLREAAQGSPVVPRRKRAAAKRKAHEMSSGATEQVLGIEGSSAPVDETQPPRVKRKYVRRNLPSNTTSRTLPDDDLEDEDEPIGNQQNPGVPSTNVRKLSKAELKERATKTRSQLALTTDFLDIGKVPAEMSVRFDVEVSEPNEAARKRKHHPSTSMSQDEENRFIIAVIVQRTLAGGKEMFSDWVLLSTIFQNHSYTWLRSYWRQIREGKERVIDKITADFRAAYPLAYQKGLVPKFNFDKMLSNDWDGLIRWVQNNVVTPENSDEVLLPSTRKAVESRYQIMDIDIANDWRETYHSMTLSKYKRVEAACTIPRVLPVTEPFSAPIDEEAAEVDRCARSWARAAVFTPDHDWNLASDSVRSKVKSFGEAIAKRAVDDLLRSKVVMHRNKGRSIPGRGLEGTDIFWATIRKHMKESQFIEAVTYKRWMDEEFRSGTPCLMVDYMANEGTVMALTSLQAKGHIKIECLNVPREKFGLTDEGYETKTIPRERITFEMTIMPTSTYLYDDENEVLQNILSSVPPRDDGGDKIPLWYGISEIMILDMWKKVIVAVSQVVALRAGITLDGLTQTFKPTMERWELNILMDWGAEVGLFERISPRIEGWTVTEWWWAVAGRLCTMYDAIV